MIAKVNSKYADTCYVKIRWHTRYDLPPAITQWGRKIRENVLRAEKRKEEEKTKREEEKTQRQQLTARCIDQLYPKWAGVIANAGADDKHIRLPVSWRRKRVSDELRSMLKIGGFKVAVTTFGDITMEL
jgi:hypothetical protein